MKGSDGVGLAGAEAHTVFGVAAAAVVDASAELAAAAAVLPAVAVFPVVAAEELRAARVASERPAVSES